MPLWFFFLCVSVLCTFAIRVVTFLVSDHVHCALFVVVHQLEQLQIIPDICVVIFYISISLSLHLFHFKHIDLIDLVCITACAKEMMIISIRNQLSIHVIVLSVSSASYSHVALLH